jgi:acetyl esterase/lipase
MNNIDYQHNTPPSFESKLLQYIMGLFGMKKKMEKKMITNSFVKEPAKPPGSLLRNYNIEVSEQNGRKVWTIYPKESKSDVAILYLHGGAYMGNISKQHWDLIEQLIYKTKATIIVPDYPLTPEAGCKETYDFIDILYSKLITAYPAKRIIFMGDSAGGGLAFGFVQQLRNENKMQPHQIIIFSPWLNVTMDNPNIELIDKEDKMLSIIGLRNAGQKYAGTLDLRDYRVSPIYGDLTGLCRISIFTGTKDILNADAIVCKQLMKDQQINFNYFEYPKMFHDWVIITSLKESQNVISKVNNLVNDYE